MQKKEGVDISFVLIPEQRKSGVSLRMHEKNIDLYVGKRRVANFNPEYVSVESLRSAADSYKNNLPLLKNDITPMDMGMEEN